MINETIDNLIRLTAAYISYVGLLLFIFGLTKMVIDRKNPEKQKKDKKLAIIGFIVLIFCIATWGFFASWE